MGPSKIVVVGPSIRRLGVEELKVRRLVSRDNEWEEGRMLRYCLRYAGYEVGEWEEERDIEREKERKHCHGILWGYRASESIHNFGFLTIDRCVFVFLARSRRTVMRWKKEKKRIVRLL